MPDHWARSTFRRNRYPGRIFSGEGLRAPGGGDARRRPPSRSKNRRDQEEKVLDRRVGSRAHDLAAAAHVRLSSDEEERDVAADRGGEGTQFLGRKVRLPQLREEGEGPRGVRASASEARADRDSLFQADGGVCGGPPQPFGQGPGGTGDEVGVVRGNRQSGAGQPEGVRAVLHLDRVGQVDRDDSRADLVKSVGAERAHPQLPVDLRRGVGAKLHGEAGAESAGSFATRVSCTRRFDRRSSSRIFSGHGSRAPS